MEWRIIDSQKYEKTSAAQVGDGVVVRVDTWSCEGDSEAVSLTFAPDCYLVGGCGERAEINARRGDANRGGPK